jgi:outer membrane protein OmpA-like peptidoglycan-associated protein
LVLFDFDKAEVSPADMEIIDKYILPAIKFNSTVQVYGYTDRIGDEEYNRKLAERRATAVSNIIKQKKKDVKIETFDVGEKVLIFDNDTPVGRHLSRTVQVIVTTPK